MKDFFISYNKADRNWAEWIAWQLEDAGYRVTIQAWDFRPGSNFVLDMQRGLSEAERVIAVLSPDFLNALYTQPEWATAFANDPTGSQSLLVPVRVRECSPTGLLKQVVYIDVVGISETEAKESLLAGIVRGRAKPQTAPGFPSATLHTINTKPDFLWLQYLSTLERKVSTVRIFGDEAPHALDHVFVELSLNEDYERRPNQAEFMGMMDSELRRMRSVFGDTERQPDDDDPTQRHQTKIKRTLKPDELLRRQTHAVITGAPGCGKTTLLRYLAWQTLKVWRDANEGGTGSVSDLSLDNASHPRLPVFLELKQLTAAAFQAAQGQLEDLLFNAAIAARLKPSEAERDALRQHFYELLRAGRVAVFLDGLDEVSGASFSDDLKKMVSEFLSWAYGQNTVIISTRPYALRQFGNAKPMEILPLNPRQIEQFIEHYYRDVPERQQFQRELQRRRELRQLASVPALLGYILLLWRDDPARVTDDKLELYEQITLKLAQQLDTEKEGVLPNRKWLEPDETGSLKLDLLRQLAFNQLFKGLIRPPYDIGSTDNDATRLVFTGEQLRDEAIAFARALKEREGVSLNPRNLAEDVKATALLRQVGTDHYAFAHLTLQEYLAAWQLAKRDNGDTCERIFCRAYFNPTLAEMEVLPMTLGLVDEPDKFYEALEQLPESLGFKGLRLRVRGLGYVKLPKPALTKLVDLLIEFITEKRIEGIAYLEPICSSCSGSQNEFMKLLVSQIASLLSQEDNESRWRAAKALRFIGSDQAVDELLKFLWSSNEDDQNINNYALGEVCGALVEIGSDHAVTSLLAALEHRNFRARATAAKALGELGADIAVDNLLIALQDQDINVRWKAAIALGEIGSERAIEKLAIALQRDDIIVARSAARALVRIGSDRAMNVLSLALSDLSEAELNRITPREIVHEELPSVTEATHTLHTVESLLANLEGKATHIFWREEFWNACLELEQVNNLELVNGLRQSLLHGNSFVRSKSAKIISYYAHDKKILQILLRLTTADKSEDVRDAVCEAIRKIERKLQYFDIPIPNNTTNTSSQPSPPPPLTAQEQAELEMRIAIKYQEVLHGSEARQKGKALEDLLAALFATISGFTISERNYHTATEEIDLVLRNASADPFWRGWGSLILVEAKHWHAQRVGKNEYVQFYRKLETRGGHCQLGFLICTERFAETFHLEALRDSRDRLRVVPIDGDGLRQLVEAADRAALLRQFVERAVLR